MSVDYNFPSNFRAPKGFKSYLPRKISEKKQVDWASAGYWLAIWTIGLVMIALAKLLYSMYLYSLNAV